VLMVRTDTT